MTLEKRVGAFGCTELALYLAEGFAYDTGAKPAITYKKGTFADVAGNLLPDISSSMVTVTDQADPILVGAMAYDITAGTPFEQVRLTWSEETSIACLRSTPRWGRTRFRVSPAPFRSSSGQICSRRSGFR